jgi:hypothetical protein
VEIVASRHVADEQVSLDIYNEVWAHDALTLDDVRSFKAGLWWGSPS